MHNIKVRNYDRAAKIPKYIPRKAGLFSEVSKL